LRASTTNTTAHARSSTLVPRKTLSQPSADAMTGPPKTAADWPIVPRPYTPSATPCLAPGVHRDTKAAPMEKDDPASPRKNAAATRLA
jgi:hypothetical protein